MDLLAQEYENKAKVALMLAKASFDVDVRRGWLNIAGQCVALAKERRNLLGIPSEPVPSSDREWPNLTL